MNPKNFSRVGETTGIPEQRDFMGTPKLGEGSNDSLNRLEDLSDDDGDGPAPLNKLQRYGGFDNLLEHAISHRPTREELIQKNILKDEKISPRLIATQEELKKKKLEDALKTKLETRSQVQDLVNHNILKDPTVSGTIQARQEELKRQILEDELESKLRNRAPVDDLKAKDIIKTPEGQTL
ncbi:hypothetical protein BKA69DRAFT_1128554 [Paraphysoderma sedebokerense]|nr:hypothetical protein BKA69DRAFT_1128554 [Paraphysoderma sedebokerense]